MGKRKSCDTKLQMALNLLEISDSSQCKSKIAAKSLVGREIRWKDGRRPWLSRFAMR